MGLIQELADLFGKVAFFTVVHEYEQGLYFRRGISIEKPIRRLKADDLAEIETLERAVRQKRGRFQTFFGFGRAALPHGFRRSWSGRVLHQRRYSKILRAGAYFHFPLFDHIVTDYKQERVLDLGYVSVLTSDPEPESKVVIVSCNLRFEMMDFYRAYTAVYDYEVSLRYHTLSILAQKSVGKKFDDWKKPETIIELEKKVVEELRKLVTEKWGIKLHQVYVTDVTNARIFKFVGDTHTTGREQSLLVANGE
jgi:hypothetical protein